MLFVDFKTRLLLIVPQAKQSKQLLTKKIVYYQKRRCTYFLIEIGEKDMKASIFYLIHPANSNSLENSGILTRFPCFMSNF